MDVRAALRRYPRRRGGDPRRGALADRLACPAPLLCAMRNAERRRFGGWGRHCPNCKAHHLSARRSGRDHARGQGRTLPARPRPPAPRRRAFRASPVLWSRARPWRRRCAAKSSRNRDSRRPRALPRLAALAVSVDPDDGIVSAEALSEEITIDPEELAEARWFEREEVRAMVERSRIRRPDPGACRPCRRPWPSATRSARRWAFGIDSI